MYVISTSYGNDSIALIQWAHENKLDNVFCVYIDTLWAAPQWYQRINEGEQLARSYGFAPVRIRASRGFQSLIRKRKGFPSQRYQWCSSHLKGIPFLNWIEDKDPQGFAWILIGKWSGESRERVNVPHFTPYSEYHNGRMIWHPLCYEGREGRDALIHRAGFEVLPHRSLECSPCVNASKPDTAMLTSAEVKRVRRLEQHTGQNMFRPSRRMGAEGIDEVMRWARTGRGCYNKEDEQGQLFCSHGMCGH